jgi:hypothetical protein
VLVLGAFPWVLLANVRAMAAQTRSLLPALGAGIAAGSLFVVKYSALLPCLALAVAWASLAAVRPAPRAALRAGAYVAGAGVALAALRMLDVPGGPTPGDVTAGASALARAPYPFAMLPLALTDLDALLRFAFDNPSRPWLSPFDSWIFGVPALVLLTAALAPGLGPSQRERLIDRPEALAAARCTLALILVVPALLGFLLARGATIDDSARHVRLASLAALPWVVTILWQQWTAPSLRRRVVACAAGALIVVLPCAYGAASLLDKAVRRARTDDPLVGATGLRQPLLGPNANTRVFMRAVRAALEGPETVLFVTSPDLALELVGARLVVRHADFLTVRRLARRRFDACPVGGVLALLPRPFEDNGKGPQLRRNFVDVAEWERVELAGGSEIDAWRGRCAARAEASSVNSSP